MAYTIYEWLTMDLPNTFVLENVISTDMIIGLL